MKKRELLEYYVGRLNPISIVMLTMLWWMNGEMSAEDRDYVLNLVGYTYNPATKTLSNGEAHTIYQLFLACINEVYPSEIILDAALMQTFIEIAHFNGFLTTEEKTGLVALL